MRAREKMLINNGGTVLGSHSMPHAMMNYQQQMKPVHPPSGITGSLGGSVAYGSETGGQGGQTLNGASNGKLFHSSSLTFLGKYQSFNERNNEVKALIHTIQ